MLNLQLKYLIISLILISTISLIFLPDFVVLNNANPEENLHDGSLLETKSPTPKTVINIIEKKINNQPAESNIAINKEEKILPAVQQPQVTNNKKNNCYIGSTEGNKIVSYIKSGLGFGILFGLLGLIAKADPGDPNWSFFKS